MSRWLKNVNALLENLDSQVEETVEDVRLNRTLSAAVKKGEEGGDGGGAEAVAELLQEEAQGVDDILAKRGLLGEDDNEDEVDGVSRDVGKNNVATAGGDEGENDATSNNEQLEGGGIGVAKKTPDEQQTLEVAAETNEEGEDDAASEEINFDTQSREIGEQKKDLFEDAPAGNVSADGQEDAKLQTKKAAPSSGNQKAATNDAKDSNSTAATKPKQQAPTSAASKAPSSSNISAPPKSGNSNQISNAAASATNLKELRKLRRHVLQLNSDLETAEREIEAQRAELDRAASRMERDRSRAKQEKEASEASHKAEIAALVASHESMVQSLKDANESVMGEMQERVARAEQLRATEGGERDAELAEALERERASVGLTATLQEEKSTMDGRITSLNTEVSRLETRLEHATSQMELASERERNAEEQLDKALSLHARQLGVRQRRESELEQTVADLGGALVVAKNKVEAAMRAGINLDGSDDFGRSTSSSGAIAEEDPLDLKARLQDSQDEIETLRAQLGLERQRCSTLHNELQDLSKEQADELSGAHAKQRQYERKISDLTTTVGKLQSTLRRVATSSSIDEDALLRGDSADIDAATGENTSGTSTGQYSGDEKKETDHLRKQIASLSEKIFEQQSRIDGLRAENSTMKNRLRAATVKAETIEKSLETANQRLITIDVPMSGMSSADEEMGLVTGGGRRRIKKHRPMGGALGTARKGFRKTSKVESISSALGLHPGRFPSGGWQEMIASLLDTFDALAVDLGSHFRHYPVSRLAFMFYMLILHLWAFFLLVYHAHAQGTGTEGHYGPEALLHSYRHFEQVHGAGIAKVVEGASASAVNATP